MPLGKYRLALNYTLHQIDRHIPPFQRDLLTAWHTHADYHQRINPPITLPDILKEPLFHNPPISANSAALHHLDWIKAGVLSIEDICSSVISGFLPPLAVHELLTQNDENTTHTHYNALLMNSLKYIKQSQLTGPDYYTDKRLLNNQHYNHYSQYQLQFQTNQLIHWTTIKLISFSNFDKSNPKL